MYHYVYRITNKQKNKHYYGVRSTESNPKDDLGFSYFSSSSDIEFINEQLRYPNNFKYKVIKTFETVREAEAYETFLHHRFDVSKNKKFYNLKKSGKSVKKPIVKSSKKVIAISLSEFVFGLMEDEVNNGAYISELIIKDKMEIKRG